MAIYITYGTYTYTASYNITYNTRHNTCTTYNTYIAIQLHQLN